MIKCLFYGWKAHDYFERISTNHHPNLHYSLVKRTRFPFSFSFTRQIRNRYQRNLLGKLMNGSTLGVDLDVIWNNDGDLIHSSNVALISKHLPYVYSFDHLVPIPPLIGPFLEERALLSKKWYQKIPHFKIQLKIFNVILNTCAKLLPNSYATKQLVEQFFDINPERMQVLYFGIKEIKNIDSIIKSRLENKETIKILFIGSDFFRKGGLDVIRAYKIIRKTYKNISLTIVTFKNKLWTHILEDFSKRDSGISIFYNIPVNKIHKFYEDAHIYICPTLAEAGIGFTITDASNYALPVISSNVHAMPEGVIHGKTGFLINPLDYQKLAEHVAFLIDNETARIQMGIEARKFVTTKFSQKKLNLQLYKVYKTIIENQ